MFLHRHRRRSVGRSTDSDHDARHFSSRLVQAAFGGVDLSRSAQSALARWAVTGSNRRPPACKAGALPAELTAHVGAPSGIRTRAAALKGLCPGPLVDGGLPVNLAATSGLHSAREGRCLVGRAGTFNPKVTGSIPVRPIENTCYPTIERQRARGESLRTIAEREPRWRIDRARRCPAGRGNRLPRHPRARCLIELGEGMGGLPCESKMRLAPDAGAACAASGPT